MERAENVEQFLLNRSRTLDEEEEDISYQVKDSELLMGDAVDSTRQLEEEVRALKIEVVDAREQHLILEENHSALIRAADELRADTLLNRYF